MKTISVQINVLSALVGLLSHMALKQGSAADIQHGLYNQLTIVIHNYC